MPALPPQILLGIIASATIYLGLLVAFVPRLSEKTRGFLNAVSTGILIFILVEIMGKVLEGIEELFVSARSGFPQLGNAMNFSVLLVLGLAAGLLAMVYFENAYIRAGKDKVSPRSDASRLALMIAIGIGIHNLTEGLAIAQAYAWGDGSLATFLAVGFGLHNATEGFGIAAPLSGQKVSWKFLLGMGLIAGGPTLLGVVVGTYWQSEGFRMLSFGLASGAILYVVGELLHLGRRLKGEVVVELGLLAGFTLAFAAEMFIVSMGGL